jgi:hypothetical protein
MNRSPLHLQRVCSGSSPSGCNSRRPMQAKSSVAKGA